MAATVTRPGEVAQDINVLPMIDVLLVLIILFLLMFRGLIFIPAAVPPPATEGQAPPSVDQIVLALRADGSYAINTQPIPQDQLEVQLRAIYGGRPHKLLFIQAADNRSYQEVITAMDVAREAGVETLAWVPKVQKRQGP
jgi:biopolymer transport protein ExbD